MPYLGQRYAGCAPLQLLFVGINPSYVPKVLREHWQAVHRQALDDNLTPLQWQPRSAPALQTLVEQLEGLDLHSIANYPRYYGPLANFASNVGAANWHALDLYPVRVRSQSDLSAVLIADEPLPEPAAELMAAFVEQVSQWQPRVVVVANALASRLLVRHGGLRRQANGHRYEHADCPQSVFLLSGMLSGAGQQDEFSRERLAADVRAALHAQVLL